MFLLSFLLLLGLITFKIVTLILKWKILFKIYRIISYTLMWNLSIWYL